MVIRLKAQTLDESVKFHTPDRRHATVDHEMSAELTDTSSKPKLTRPLNRSTTMATNVTNATNRTSMTNMTGMTNMTNVTYFTNNSSINSIERKQERAEENKDNKRAIVSVIIAIIAGLFTVMLADDHMLLIVLTIICMIVISNGISTIAYSCISHTDDISKNFKVSSKRVEDIPSLLAYDSVLRRDFESLEEAEKVRQENLRKTKAEHAKKHGKGVGKGGFLDLIKNIVQDNREEKAKDNLDPNIDYSGSSIVGPSPRRSNPSHERLRKLSSKVSTSDSDSSEQEQTRPSGVEKPDTCQLLINLMKE